ncbi:MAG: hypothetical protein GDA50_04090 [Alphaproteobacteria bacterium GM202ARS2]|nr:hypothetical protein [Alphaproteobacteria bacterium GM202ARS2]
MVEKPSTWTSETLNVDVDPDEAIDLITKIRPLLAHRHPGISGAALAHLTAIWVLGFAPEMRDVQYENLMSLIRSFIAAGQQEADEARRQYERAYDESNDNQHH